MVSTRSLERGELRLLEVCPFSREGIRFFDWVYFNLYELGSHIGIFPLLEGGFNGEDFPSL